MNFDKESKSEENFIYLLFFCGGGVGERGGQEEDSNQTKTKKTIGIRLFFVLMLHIKFQVPGSSGSLVLTQTKGVTYR